MMDSLYIAWKYIGFNKVKTATLVACITLISFLPAVLQLLLNESERQLISRAISTPLVVGAKGSALDLVMNTLYFDDQVPDLINMAEADQVSDTNLAMAIPLYVRFRTRGCPIVGTTLDYFEYRGLKVFEGRAFALLGECVVGAKVAKRFTIKVGDSLVSSPENLFDLAGVYPLKMKVVGVLEKSNASDDLGVFVDIKTTWVIQGLGHGHEDVRKTKDSTVILKRSETNVTANAKLFNYMEISEKNIEAFHFHGDMGIYPITAVVAVPYDTKSGTLLRGRYLSGGETHQIVKPEAVIDGLLQNIFRIKSVIDAVVSVVALATVMAIILVFALSLRLRQQELETIFKLGCSKLTIARLIAAEIIIIITISGMICTGAVLATDRYAIPLVHMIFIS